MLRTMIAAGALLAAFSVFAAAQPTQGAAGKQQAGSRALEDAIVDGLKFHPVGGFIQIVDVAKSQSAGTIILPPNQAPVIAAMPGYEARIKAAYEKYSHGSTGDAAPAAEAAPATPAPTPATAAGFDAASKTAGLSGGRSVTFVDNDNLKVIVPGPAGDKTYALHYHGASAGGIMKGWAGREQGRVGGSAGGGGVAISLEPQNGMPGGEVYDTAKGAVYGNSGLQQAKLVIAAVREAVDMVKGSTQPNLAKLPVVKSLLSNNLGV